MKDVVQFQALLWEKKPECTEATADLWFADPNDEEEKYGKSEQAIAVGICKRCPIKAECFDHAIANGIEHGIWGGALPQQRQAYWSKMRRSA